MKSEFGRAFQRSGRRGWSIRYRRGGQEVVEAGYRTRRDARAALNRIHSEISRAEAIGIRPVGRKTFAEFEEEFLAFLKRKHKESTFAGDVAKWRGVILPAWGDAVLADVTRSDVELWLTKRSTGTAPGARRAVGGSTLNRDLSFLSVMFKFAIDLRLAHESPCLGIRRAKEEEREYPYLSEEDVARIVRHAQDDIAPFLEFLAGTGVRLSEAQRLRWCDVYLTPTDGCPGELVVRKSKSSRARRIPLRIRVAAVLEALHFARSPGDDPSDIVFPEIAKRDRSLLGRQFHRACRAAGFGENIRVHDLRHHFGSNLARRGVPIPDIAALMGHETLSVTLRYAKHAPKDAASRAIRMLDGGDVYAAQPEAPN